MKLRNILIASLVLPFVLGACSKGDDPQPQGPPTPVDAVFSIQLTANPITKAVTGDEVTDPSETIKFGEDTERFINTLNVYVFKADGNLAYYKQEKAVDDKNSISKVEDILIKVLPKGDGTSDDQFKMVLIANIADLQVATLSELEAKTLESDVEQYNKGTGIYLPMMSVDKGGVYQPIVFSGLKTASKNEDGTLKEKNTNWIAGDGSVHASSDAGTDQKIQLRRMVARVQIDKISVELDDRYPTASFRLDTISLANVRTAVNYKVEAGAGDYVKGYQSFVFKEENGIIVPGKDKVKECFSYHYPESDKSFSNDASIFDDTNVTDLAKKHFCKYVFPNQNGSQYSTGILLSGHFKPSAQAAEELRHFWIPLNKGGVNAVLPNTIYRLEIAINGEGSKNEDKPELTAGVTATITVADWKVIHQVEEDEN